MSNGGTIVKHMGTPTATSEPRQGFPMQREVLVRQELLPSPGLGFPRALSVLSATLGNLGTGHQCAKVGLAVVKGSPEPRSSPLVLVTHLGILSCSFRFNICSLQRQSLAVAETRPPAGPIYYPA